MVHLYDRWNIFIILAVCYPKRGGIKENVRIELGKQRRFRTTLAYIDRRLTTKKTNKAEKSEMHGCQTWKVIVSIMSKIQV